MLLCSLSGSAASIRLFYRHHQSSMDVVALGLKAITLGLLAQLLMLGLEMAIELSSFPLPSSILAMFLLFVFLLLLGCCWDGFEAFYTDHLRQPAHLVNRHMSIGFSVPIVMLARGPVAPGDTIARIIACFLTAGVVSTIATYVAAISSQRLLGFCARYLTLPRRRSRFDDEESHCHHVNERCTGHIVDVVCAKIPISFSDISSAPSLENLGQQNDRGDAEGSVEERGEPSLADEIAKSPAQLAVNWALRNPLLVSSWLLTFVICIPLRYGARLDEPLGIFLLFALWTTTQTVQAGIRSSSVTPLRILRTKLRIVLSVACNPVLWTATGLLAYAAAESHGSDRPLFAVLATLERNTTFADLVMHRSRPSSGAYTDFPLSSRGVVTPNPSWLHRPTPAVAAGDVANAILSAGLVCWGLKLWEYRRRLLSIAGFVVLAVSCAAAVANVILGPLLAKGMLGPHGQPGYDLAFAARTVTLALGAPAVARIGGDVGLNAAMVVANGIMCQMLLGLGVGEWLERVVVGGVRGMAGKLTGRAGLCWARHDEQDTSAEKGTDPGDSSVLPASTLLQDSATSHAGRRSDTTSASSTSKNTTAIASGVTIGINAAAMGTAHLYEAGSDAAPYAALAMTVFGVATVGFTMIPQLGEWIAARVQ